MEKKILSGTMLTLLLFGILTLASNVQPVRASGTIYIKADGSVDPHTAPIQRDGDVYTFTGNIYDGIVVERDNIVVDGAGYTVQGAGKGWGILLTWYRNNVTLKDVEVTNFGCGIYLWDSNNNVLTGNTVSNNSIGIYLWYSRNNGLTGNTVSNNGYGILLEDSSSNGLTGNTVSNNGYGIWLESYWLGSCSNVLTGNIASNNDYGIYLWRSHSNSLSGNVASSNNEYGIYLWESCSNSLSGNTASNNGYGICLGAHFPYECSNNVLTGNTVSNNYYGIYLLDSWYSILFHNNFINNSRQALDIPGIPPNTWDAGYPSGGNYWSDHIGVDEFSGPNQDEPSADGIADTPYYPPFQDNYPLMKPYGGAHDIGITRIAPSETSVEPGSMLDINVTVLNYGFYTETFNLTAYANTTVISRTEVTLSSRKSATITFTWDTTGVTLGTYALKAQASTVPGETDITDNTLIEGQVGINIRDTAVLQVTVAPTYVKVGETVYINVTVANQGTVTETFDVTTYYNTSSIETKTSILLDAGESITLEFSWNTTSVTAGRYIIIAYASPVPNEIDTADNYFEDGVVTMVTPQYLTQKLIETIETWNLPEGTESSLSKKLEDVLHLLKMGNENGAIHKLRDFINHVEAIRGKKLTNEQADQLVAEAQRIMEVI